MGGSISRLMRSVQSKSSKNACCFKAVTPPITNMVPRDAPSRLLLCSDSVSDSVSVSVGVSVSISDSVRDNVSRCVSRSGSGSVSSSQSNSQFECWVCEGNGRNDEEKQEG